MLFGAGLIGLAVGLFTPAAIPAPVQAQEPVPGRREFEITARRYEYAPARIEVTQDDLVKITLSSDDIPHSFTIDEYRIAKRVGAGQTVTFEFRADQPGTFRIYCNLKQDEKCRTMRAALVVKPRR
ncbi:MAG TPA: cupredoxin domain-containing protein [Vicinamibacterales bacterium]|nr:cupredoxin domain-containing protein [Vicinamibacterales bacterium]